MVAHVQCVIELILSGSMQWETIILLQLRGEAYQRKSDADKLVKDTIAALKKWDTKTEDLVSQLCVILRDIFGNYVATQVYQSCLS